MSGIQNHSLRNLGPLLLVALLASGCSSLRTKPTTTQPNTPPPLPPATAEQKAWFESHRDQTHYEPNRGYRVDGFDGYYDDQGRPLPPESAKAGPVESDDGNSKGLANTFSSKNITLAMKKMVGRAANEGISRAAYAEAQDLFRQQRYLEAAKKYDIAFDRGPDLPIEEDAMFKAGECYFFCDRYAKSDDRYGQVIKKYSNSQYKERLVARRFAIARYWEECDLLNHHYALTPNLSDKTRPMFDTRGHALRVYDRVRLDDPSGPLEDDALMATANLHFRIGSWEDAAYFYDLLRKQCPKSEHQFNAHLLGLESQLRSYQGPQYDVGPLDNADELAAQLLSQFPRDLSDQDKDRIVETRAKIRAAKAERDFEIATYYHKNKYYTASRMYFSGVANAYPDTKLAQEALAKIEEVKDKPGSPKPAFAWIDKVVQPASYVIGNMGSASSGIPSGMPQTPMGVGTLGGMGGGMPALGGGT